MPATISGSHHYRSSVKDAQRCIYYVRNTVNGRGYVGKHGTSDAERRWLGHTAQARRGSRYAFHCALRKYGLEAFTWEVVWRGPVSLLNAREIHYIKQYKTCTDNVEGGYNLTYGGEGGVPSKLVREKRAKAIKAAWKDNPDKCAEHGLMLRAIFARSDQKAQRSVLRKLDWLKPEYRAKMAKRSSGMRGKEHTMKTRLILAESTKRWFQNLTAEQRAANSLARSKSRALVWQNKSEKKREEFRAAIKSSWSKRKEAINTKRSLSWRLA